MAFESINTAWRERPALSQGAYELQKIVGRLHAALARTSTAGVFPQCGSSGFHSCNHPGSSPAATPVANYGVASSPHEESGITQQILYWRIQRTVSLQKRVSKSHNRTVSAFMEWVEADKGQKVARRDRLDAQVLKVTEFEDEASGSGWRNGRHASFTTAKSTIPRPNSLFGRRRIRTALHHDQSR